MSPVQPAKLLGCVDTGVRTIDEIPGNVKAADIHSWGDSMGEQGSSLVAFQWRSAKPGARDARSLTEMS